MSEFDIGTHMVQFYEDAAFLLDTLTKLAGTALVAGDAAIIICPWWMGLPEEHSNLRQAVAAVRAGLATIAPIQTLKKRAALPIAL